jgi:hypothetical protein
MSHLRTRRGPRAKVPKKTSATPWNGPNDDGCRIFLGGRARPNLATVRLRTKVTKGAGSREAGMAMAFKLLDAAQAT